MSKPKNAKIFANQKIVVTIVGAGNVGSAIAYALTIRNIAAEINIVDINKEKTSGQVMDIADGMAFVETGHVVGSTFKNAKNSDIIIITAGAKQKSGDTRLDLAGPNKKIMKDIFTKIGKLKSNAIVLIVSNPVDVLTHYVQKITNLPSTQIIGSGTTLDTARLRTKLADHFNVSAQNIHGYVFGEHGDSEFVAWSSVTIGGVPIKKLPHFTQKQAKKIEEAVRKEAYTIIERKGATYYGIGLSVANIVKAILYDQHLILPVSSRLNNWNGISGVCLGALAVIGRCGVEKHWPMQLSAAEKQKLKRSAKILKKYL